MADENVASDILDVREIMAQREDYVKSLADAKANEKKLAGHLKSTRKSIRELESVIKQIDKLSKYSKDIKNAKAQVGKQKNARRKRRTTQRTPRNPGRMG